MIQKINKTLISQINHTGNTVNINNVITKKLEVSQLLIISCELQNVHVQHIYKTIHENINAFLTESF